MQAPRCGASSPSRGSMTKLPRPSERHSQAGLSGRQERVRMVTSSAHMNTE